MLQLKLVIDPAEGQVPAGIHMMIGRTHTVFMADTTVHESPDAVQLAAIRTDGGCRPPYGA